MPFLSAHVIARNEAISKAGIQEDECCCVREANPGDRPCEGNK
jgi:hypothetical protein